MDGNFWIKCVMDNWKFLDRVCEKRLGVSGQAVRGMHVVPVSGCVRDD